jgi:hypothetical protein
VDKAVRPGELVVKRERWMPGSDLTGIVVGCDDLTFFDVVWLVMWTLTDRRISLKWHLASSLEVVNAHNVADVSRRRSLACT